MKLQVDMELLVFPLNCSWHRPASIVMELQAIKIQVLPCTCRYCNGTASIAIDRRYCHETAVIAIELQHCHETKAIPWNFRYCHGAAGVCMKLQVLS
jgi:hypothetical protein